MEICPVMVALCRDDAPLALLSAALEVGRPANAKPDQVQSRIKMEFRFIINGRLYT